MFIDKQYLCLSKVTVFPKPWGVLKLEASAQFTYEEWGVGDREFLTFPVDSTQDIPLDGFDVQSYLIANGFLKMTQLRKTVIYTNWWGHGDYIHRQR